MILDYNTDPRGPHSLCCPIKYHPRANILGLKSGPDQPLTKWEISISSSSQSFLAFHHCEKKRLRAIWYVQCVVLSLKYVTSVQQFIPVDNMDLCKKETLLNSTHTTSKYDIFTTQLVLPIQFLELNFPAFFQRLWISKACFCDCNLILFTRKIKSGSARVSKRDFSSVWDGWDVRRWCEEKER